jgi:hypothetical protein
MCHKKNHLKRREGYLAILEMDSFNNSVDELQRLLSTGQSSHFGSCRITKIPRDILHMINRIEYCAVEITCDDATQYGIQAYGEEAIELHKEALNYDE